MNNSKYYQVQNYYPHLKYPEKYLAENKVITIRSSWEKKFIDKFLEFRTDVVGWTSESFFIPYFYPVDNKMHRYFPDFKVRLRTKEGKIVERILEIKPWNDTQIPKKPQRMTKSYVDRVNTYIKNSSKWAAAEKYCADLRSKGVETYFDVITEKDFPFV
jgi:hypothetical protein